MAEEAGGGDEEVGSPPLALDDGDEEASVAMR